MPKTESPGVATQEGDGRWRGEGGRGRMAGEREGSGRVGVDEDNTKLEMKASGHVLSSSSKGAVGAKHIARCASRSAMASSAVRGDGSA